MSPSGRPTRPNLGPGSGKTLPPHSQASRRSIGYARRQEEEEEEEEAEEEEEEEAPRPKPRQQPIITSPRQRRLSRREEEASSSVPPPPPPPPPPQRQQQQQQARPRPSTGRKGIAQSVMRNPMRSRPGRRKLKDSLMGISMFLLKQPPPMSLLEKESLI